MIKLCLIIIIILCSYCYALHLINKVEASTEQYNELIYSMNELLRQIKLFKSESDLAFYKSFNVLNKNELIDCLKTNKRFNQISQQDKKILFEYLNNFGYGDSSLEINKCNDEIERLKDQYKAKKEEQQKKSKLYKVLSVSFGLILSVLVI